MSGFTVNNVDLDTIFVQRMGTTPYTTPTRFYSPDSDDLIYRYAARQANNLPPTTFTNFKYQNADLNDIFGGFPYNYVSFGGFTYSFSWTVPPFVTSINMAVVGGGGGGSGYSNTTFGSAERFGGGNGGATGISKNGINLLLGYGGYGGSLGYGLVAPGGLYSVSGYLPSGVVYGGGFGGYGLGGGGGAGGFIGAGGDGGSFNSVGGDSSSGGGGGSCPGRDGYNGGNTDISSVLNGTGSPYTASGGPLTPPYVGSNSYTYYNIRRYSYPINTVQTWSGGGGGGQVGGYSNGGSGGGGGCAWIRGYPVTPGDTFFINTGQGGSSNDNFGIIGAAFICWGPQYKNFPGVLGAAIPGTTV
jgi:hypothetical protein